MLYRKLNVIINVIRDAGEGERDLLRIILKCVHMYMCKKLINVSRLEHRSMNIPLSRAAPLLLSFFCKSICFF